MSGSGFSYGSYKRAMPKASGSRYTGYRKAPVTRFRKGYNRTGGYYGRYKGVTVGEKKFHDIDIDDAAVSVSGSILNSGSLCQIAQGTTESTRVGRKAVIRSINWRYQINLGSETTVANGADTVRIVLYKDKQANGQTATVTDILETANYQSFRNLANSARFQILLDKLVTVSSGGGAGNGTTDATLPVIRNYSFFKKCKIPIEYSSTTGAIGEIRSNNLGVLLSQQLR